ncbi:MAG: hypothetical protein AB7S42_06620 [Lysobacteraceae bacterium]
MMFLNKIEDVQAAYAAAAAPIVIFLASIGFAETGVGVIAGVLFHLCLCLLIEVTLAKAKSENSESSSRVSKIFFFSTIITALVMVLAIGYALVRRDVDARTVMFTLVSSSWILGAFLKMCRRL